MIIQCPTCDLKLRPKPPDDTKPGAKVQVKCRCGTILRFTMPERTPQVLPSELVDIWDRWRHQMGGAR